MKGITTFDPLNREHPTILAKTIRRTIDSTANPSFLFDADNELKDAIIIGFAVRRDSATRLSADGNALINDTLFDKAFLNIKAGGHDDVYQIPLEWLEYEGGVNTPGTYAQMYIKDWQVEKSGVSFASAAGAVVDEDFEMIVIYIKRDYCDELPMVG